MPVGHFTPDTMPPSLEAYVLDMDAEVLMLRFSEPMNRSSLDLRAILLQTAASALDADTSLSLQNRGSSLLQLPCHNTDVRSMPPSSSFPSLAPTYTTSVPTVVGHSAVPRGAPSNAPTYGTPAPPRVPTLSH